MDYQSRHVITVILESNPRTNEQTITPFIKIKIRILLVIISSVYVDQEEGKDWTSNRGAGRHGWFFFLFLCFFLPTFLPSFLFLSFLFCFFLSHLLSLGCDSQEQRRFVLLHTAELDSQTSVLRTQDPGQDFGVTVGVRWGLMVDEVVNFVHTRIRGLSKSRDHELLTSTWLRYLYCFKEGQRRGWWRVI